MIRLKKEVTTKEYMDKGILTTEIKQYHYDTEEEKLEHKKDMEMSGYDDSGQIKENTGTITEPNFVWFGSYFKNEFNHIKE